MGRDEKTGPLTNPFLYPIIAASYCPKKNDHLGNIFSNIAYTRPIWHSYDLK
jgi:hypothetical protein